MIGRRVFLGTGGLLLAGFSTSRLARAKPKTAEIVMRSSRDGGQVWFDPIGLWVEPGTSVIWINTGNVHTTTAYHPGNDVHSLRIPEDAAPWDSGYLVNPGDIFEVTLEVPGVYDYYCSPHEDAGMVGRIVVGKPGGPGSWPFDYFKGQPGRAAWRDVPDAARQNFPPAARIMAERIVAASAL